MKKIDLVLGLRCNSACAFCFAHDDAVADPPWAALEALLDEGCARGYEGVTISGGEPTVSPLLLDVLDACAARGLKVRLITNGLRLQRRAFAREVLSRPISRIHFSLHGCDEATVDRVNRRAGVFAAQVRALDHLRRWRPRVDLEVNCLLSTDNLHALDGLPDFLLARGVRRLTLSHLVISTDVAPELVPPMAAAAAAARRVFARAAGTPLLVQAIHFPVCLLAEWAEQTTNHYYWDDTLLTNEEAGIRRHHDDLRRHLYRTEQCVGCPHADRRCAGFWRPPTGPTPALRMGRKSLV